MKAHLNISILILLFCSKASLAGTPLPETEIKVKKEVRSEAKVDFTSTEQACSDTLYYVDGRVIPITYLRQTPGTVKFKKCDDPLNRSWSKEKIKLLKLVHADGSVEVFNEPNNRAIRDHAAQEKANSTKAVATAGVAALAVVLGVLITGFCLLWMLLTSF